MWSAGYTFELKVERTDKAAVNECAYNTLGTATRLVTWGLEMEHLVNMVTIYGIAIAMKRSNEVQVLKL